ncbi:head-tail connector protein [Primorskyibacter sp. S187A]|uniref:head-tail connector protein n=1 Tax=Primorskyibacter sp. S187A TaxID=3415130 RepID=UPI003C7A1D31
MMLREETTVQPGDLPVAQLRAHLRLGTGFGEETVQVPVLEGFLRAAMGAIEGRISKCLITRDFTLVLSQWSNTTAHPLPTAPVLTISDVILVDGNDNRTPLASSAWRLIADTHEPKIAPRAASLPSIPKGGAVEISFRAGYGAWGDLPADLQQAVLLLAAHYYENRNEMHLGQGCMPFGVTALLERYRVVRMTLGASQ